MGIQKRSIDLRKPETFSDIISRAKDDLSETIKLILPILDNVKKYGDSAVREYTSKFDGWVPEKFVWDPNEIEQNGIPEDLKEAFLIAKNNIEEFHKNQIPKNWEKQVAGNRLGIKYTAIDSVTVYAPGGKALYPSSILMGAIPAKLAGVKNIQLATPPQKDGIPPIIGYVAKLAGIDRIITVGGSQAIAACAYGTESISKSEFIVGPGNAFVAAAKTYLSGLGIIGIESPAGPSEVLIIADDTANPEWVACDLLSQAEHGEDSVAILISPSAQLLDAVEKEIEIAFETRTKRLNIKKTAIEKNSFLLKVNDMEDCVAFSNFYAPEHLEIMTKDPNKIFESVQHAGSVFLGHYSPVAMGDYISGTNHILPTAGGARLFSSLGVEHFLKRITYQEIRKETIPKLYPHVKLMSESEGLEEEHGHSVYLRNKS
ncbi:histidinol dehydrogenase [Leptospira sp. GIMC2001]|uniref:histidinol dehydrogenase n=1 Tax=Leptospira sp. GIMC2001 TaxID=1513297 RepID=UPI00234AF3D6|nr:histidinol dehydrogenase [Leptospira sp. GIMC2001]WCL48062.1 histidinol dehydrogenase [Leptospira sp. GIMC2001]